MVCFLEIHGINVRVLQAILMSDFWINSIVMWQRLFRDKATYSRCGGKYCGKEQIHLRLDESRCVNGPFFLSFFF